MATIFGDAELTRVVAALPPSADLSEGVPVRLS